MDDSYLSKNHYIRILNAIENETNCNLKLEESPLESISVRCSFSVVLFSFRFDPSRHLAIDFNHFTSDSFSLINEKIEHFVETQKEGFTQ